MSPPIFELIYIINYIYIKYNIFLQLRNLLEYMFSKRFLKCARHALETDNKALVARRYELSKTSFIDGRKNITMDTLGRNLYFATKNLRIMQPKV